MLLTNKLGTKYLPLHKRYHKPAISTGGSCTCGQCDGNAQWDTLAIGETTRGMECWTVHYPNVLANDRLYHCMPTPTETRAIKAWFAEHAQQ